MGLSRKKFLSGQSHLFIQIQRKYLLYLNRRNPSMTRYTNGLVFNYQSRTFEKGDFEVQEQYFIAPSASDTPAVDLTNCYVTPGFIDSCSQIGLQEIGIRWEGDDSFEMESNLHYSVLDGIYPFDKAFQMALQHGITASHIVPSPKSLIGAKTAVVHHTHTTVDEMVIDNNIAFTFSIGHRAKHTFFNATKKPLTRMGIAKTLRDTLQQLQQQEPAIKKIMIRAHKAVDIELIQRLQKEFHYEFHIVHATEISFIEQAKWNTVVAGPVFRYIEHNEMMALSPKLYQQLAMMNTPFVFCTDHPTSSATHLAIEAGLAVREGLSRADALYALTTGAAQFLGIENMTGSIRDGLFADFVIWNKHPLDLDAQVIATFIKGQQVYSQKAGALI